MATEHEAGSKTADGSEQTLNTTSPETTDGAFQLLVDLGNMALGDVLELRIKEKVQSSAGTQRLVWLATYQHARTEKVAVSPPILMLHGWDMTLRQTAGTNRAYPWSIRKA